MSKLSSILIVNLILISCISVHASEDWSDKPIIDKQFMVVQTEIKKVTENCMKQLKYHPIKSMKCGKELRKKYEKQGRLRGTEEYCKKNYGNLSFDEMRKVWMNLKKQRRVARISPSDRVPGEVTEGMFMVEEFWVESRLAQMQRKRTEAAEKEVFKKQ